MAIQIGKNCIRNKFDWSNCHQCSTHCPSQAIHFHPQTHVDIDVCNQCGRCIEACPFDAISGTKPTYHIQGKTLFEDNQHPPTPEKLLQLKLSGITQVELKDNNSIWFSPITSINQSLAANGLTKFDILFTDQHYEKISHSKRSLFRSLIKSPLTDKQTRRDMGSTLISEKRPLHRLIFNPNQCNLCQQCQILCPKECITINDKNITLNNENCNGCQLCSDVCVKKSLCVEHGIYQNQSISYSIEEFRCTECGTLYPQVIDESRNSQSICPACQFRKETGIAIYKIG
ncbi:4Fe-4S binding protein [Vibrio porteresiae]|uniref:4Fe-4S binding protein n=1 Tax=Vibrio porteresiae DSM 19223 TaxID=1123496 RepID=A0ABZ0QKJ9_9VIBR|nr:4Fe-4S binding protein [Vibrio porteresiae]WPC76207.1 4Fe-4S binding protein [Vibrio porteresiae DSM 19223]